MEKIVPAWRRHAVNQLQSSTDLICTSQLVSLPKTADDTETQMPTRLVCYVTITNS